MSVACPICGKDGMTVIAIHVAKAHGIDRFKLREMLDLPRNAKITDPEYSAKLAQRFLERFSEEERRAMRDPTKRKPIQLSKPGRKRLIANLKAHEATLTDEELYQQRSRAGKMRAHQRWGTPL